MPELKNIEQFREILKTYHTSERAHKIIEDLRLVLLIAPTAGGRNTIIQRLLSTGRYHYIVSDTTRPPRKNDGVMEMNGREYWFRTEEEVLADLQTGEFLEAEILHNQQISGISIRELEKAKNEGKIAVTDVDIEGIHNVLKAKPETEVVMILPPSFEVWQRRLSLRGQMRPDELKRRLQTAQKIFEDGLKQNYYNFIISEDIEQSSALIDAIVEGKPNPHQGRGHNLIEHLKAALDEKLASIT